MSLIDRIFKKNAIQGNQIGQQVWFPFVWPGKQNEKPLGNILIQVILNLIWKGLSNVTFESNQKGNTITTESIIRFIDSNATLLVNQYINQGYVCVFYDKHGNYRVPQLNEIKTDGNGQIINKFAVVYYSPTYQTERSSLYKLSIPLIMDLNKIAGAQDYLTDTLGVMGILSGSDVPLSPAGKEQMLTSMNQNYGLMDGKYRFLLANNDLKYQAVNPDVKNLGLTDRILEDYKILCNLWGVPLQLVFNDSSTFNNVHEAKVFFYDSTIRYFSEILLKIARELLTASGQFIPQSSITYFFTNLPELETSLSGSCKERMALLEYLLRLRDAGMDVDKDIQKLYNESHDLLSRV